MDVDDLLGPVNKPRTEININLSNLHNVILDHFYPILKDKNRYVFLRGGYGSGKSVFCVQKILTRILVGYKTNTIHNILVVMKTEKSTAETCYKEIKTWIYRWGLTDLCVIHKSPKEILFSNGSRIFFLGCDQPDKLLSLSGVTSIWVEEANRFSFNDFDTIDSRLRGVKNTYPQILVSFNPVSKLSYIYKHFYLQPNELATYHHSVLKDNYLLDDDQYKAKIKNYKNTNINKYNTYWLGEWGSLEGTIYNNYDIIDSFPDSFDDTYYGLDFGYNNPHALVEINDKDQEIYLKEKIYKRHLTINQLIQELKKAIPANKRRKRFIYADNAEPAYIRQINEADFCCFSSIKSVNPGIDYVQDQKLHIHKDSTNLIREIEGYVWMTDKDGESLEKPLKDNDHCFTKNTLIDTINGKVKIKDIKIGDLILTRNGYKRCVNSWCTGIKKVKKYNIYNNILECTPSHKIITKEGKKEIDRLDKNNTLYVKEDRQCQKDKLNLMELSIEHIHNQNNGMTEFITHIVSQKDQDIYTEINGNIITDQFLKDITYITKMEIHSTMNWITLNVLKEVNMHQNIQKNIIEEIEIKLKNIWKKLEFLQNHGIHLKKEEDGILNMVKKLLKRKKKQIECVNNVEKTNHLIQMGKIDSVLLNVNQNGEDKAELTTKKEYALNVMKNLQLINMKKQCVVHQNALHNIDGIRKKVYNITVEDEHEYFANNTLVANCMDAVRYGVYTHNKKKRLKPGFITYED